MKKFKKLTALILTGAMSFSVCGALASCGNRSETLKIYNCGEYMDPEVYDEFEVWYEQETGKTVKVVEDTFESNEDAYMQLRAKKTDYDLFCPSDYMVERMIREDMLIEFDKDIVDLSAISPSILLKSNDFDNGNKYSVPFMWGTFGVMYNTAHIEYNSIDSWSSIFTNQYSSASDKRLYMKNQVRDSFAAAGIYANRDTLSTLSSGFTDYNDSYKQKLNDIFADTSAAAIASAKSVLLAQKPFVCNYETDDAKFDIAANRASAGHLGLFWSCDAGYIMNDYENANGTVESGNKNIWYTIPKEGSNVYVDAFVIPKYAKNIDAANYFMSYLLRKDVAYKNMIYVGSTSAVESACAQYKSELQSSAIDEEGGFFNVEGKDDAYKNAFKKMYIDMLFPTDEILARCAVMTDLADSEQAVVQMFTEVKGA